MLYLVFVAAGAVIIQILDLIAFEIRLLTA